MAATFSLAFTPTPLGANEKMAVFATRPVSPGINFQPNGAYKLIQVSAAAAVSPLDLLADYTAIFGAPPAGQKILIRAVVINTSTGQASSPPLETSSIV